MPSFRVITIIHLEVQEYLFGINGLKRHFFFQSGNSGRMRTGWRTPWLGVGRKIVRGAFYYSNNNENVKEMKF